VTSVRVSLESDEVATEHSIENRLATCREKFHRRVRKCEDDREERNGTYEGGNGRTRSKGKDNGGRARCLVSRWEEVLEAFEVQGEDDNRESRSIEPCLASDETAVRCTEKTHQISRFVN